MLKERSEVINGAHKCLDICLTIAAFIGAYFIKKNLVPGAYGGLSTDPNYYIVLLMIIILWYATFNLFGVYNSYRKQNFWRIFWRIFKAVSAGMLFLILFIYLLQINHISRIMITIFFLLDIGLLGIFNGLVYRILAHYRSRGFNLRNILIIGSRDGAKDIINAIGNRSSSGYRLVGCLEVNQSQIGERVKNDIEIIGTIGSLEEILLTEVVDEIIITMPLKEIKDVEKHIAFAEQIGVPVRILPQWNIRRLGYEPKIGTLAIDNFLNVPTLLLTTTTLEQGKLLIKSALDYIFGGILLVLCSPLFLIISIAIKVSSKGPVFFKQDRIGRYGRKFTLYKFRTMVPDAEKRLHELAALNEADGPAFKIKNDPRIIPFIGSFLRKTSLDELPQLINVLKGELSLIGPRPNLPHEVEKYDVWQRRRLSMKPGLTCLWQIQPKRNEVPFENWMKLDLRYIDNWSLSLDFKILFRTALVILVGAGR